MSTLNQDINDSISKNLPAQVGDVLRQRLEQADKDAANLATTREELSRLRDAYEDLSVKYTAIKTEFNKHAALDQREAAVRDAERDLRVVKTELELAAEKRISTTLTDVLNKLVRNTEYRSRVLGNENIPVEGNPGGNGSYPTAGFVTTVPVDRLTTKTQE